MCMEEIAAAVCEGDDDNIVDLCRMALEGGATPSCIIKEGLTAGMMRAGEFFDSGEYFLPEMLISSMTLQKGLDYLVGCLEKESGFWRGCIVIGTVEGDTHDIGRNLVGAMLQAAGFRVIDLGIDVSAERFIESVGIYKPDIIAMSALLSTTMMNMETVIRRLSDRGLRDQVKVMIGGAVVNQRFADRIGADGYSENASQAVLLAERLICAS